MPGTTTTPSTTKLMTPLWVISLFVSLTESTLGIAAAKTVGAVQISLIVFVMVFPVLIAGAFFAILWVKPYVFYPPSEYGKVDVQKYVDALRGSGGLVTKTSDLKGSVQVFGRPDRFRLLFKASGPDWVRSTKAMEVPGGCVIQVSTIFVTSIGEQGAEALIFVPGSKVQDETGGIGSFLSASEGGI